jgi:aryl-alcohol dehydrogenase-like predicted oxidoreductase
LQPSLKNELLRSECSSGSVARGQRFPDAYDAANSANAAKLDAADALGALADEAGLTLVQMATAFATTHPAVTSTIMARERWSIWALHTAAAEPNASGRDASRPGR